MLRLAVLALICMLSHAVSVVKDCGPKDAYIKFHNIDITPMPFNILGKINVEVDVETVTQIGNDVSLNVVLQKSNLGNKFTWQVPCTNIGAITDQFNGYLGSCKYKGSCDFPFIKEWTSKKECPDFFKKYKVPCACPFPATRVKTTTKEVVDLSTFEDKMPKWLIEGGYIVKAELTDEVTKKLVGCLEMNFDVNEREKKPCPAVLQKVNACP